MGFFDWLISLFQKEGYNEKQALQYIKKNYPKYKVIKPQDRKEFEQLFLNLAKQKIFQTNRLLEESEINILAQRIRIKQFQQKEKTQEVFKRNYSQEDITTSQVQERQWSHSIALFTKTIRETINPSIAGLAKNISRIEFLEAKYADAQKRKAEDIFRNNKREFSEIEEDIRVYINLLENTKTTLSSYQRIIQKIQEITVFWKEIVSNLQKARVTNENQIKVNILSTINITLKDKHQKLTSSLLQEINSQKEKFEDFYTEVPIKSSQDQLAAK